MRAKRNSHGILVLAVVLAWGGAGAMSVSAREDDAGAAAGGKVLRAGMIGLDTSHVIAFTQRFNDEGNKNHVPGVKVVAAFKGGSPDVESSRTRVDGFARDLREKFGVRLYDSIEEMCRNVDVVMLESVDGRPHLEQVRPVIEAGRPVFVDKPVAGSLKDAIEIFRLAKEKGVPVFSASSLRWYAGVVEVAEADVGEVTGAVSVGPASVEAHHPTLFWYGIHPTEALFTVLGPGCESVVCTETDAQMVVTGLWRDGKTGTLVGIKKGKTVYKVIKFGDKAIAEQKSGGDYTPMLHEMVKFFRTGEPPVKPETTLEIYAFMEAADESARQGGKPVRIDDVLRKHGWKNE